ncbi:Fe(3+) dicitrate ABC transporter substrate-binding protein [Photobacterium chitinilyticum]|uniref:Fe(3+)-dicitrate ABC transporter substrate-binding protein FecB n=1 Tax=Photobacterium chitinilyticum TaxID=2485123 RepID=A0A3S3RIF0_9GAMM|nr:Fe(3+) dicitrate ABC transporter substrate-binding protein [Photobacterium chitinilyticum]RWX56198.1 Fe(3+)-dicitrate ABC transporter substrate-binding protein FecB [Photobacterium chitinilyticum]
MAKSIIKKLIGTLSIFILVFVFPAKADVTRTINDEMGELSLSGTPKRIVALEFSFVDAMAAVNIAPLGIADDNKPERLIPAVTQVVPEWTSVGSRYQPSLEVIADLKPDLIIADVERHSAIYDDLKRIAPTLIIKSRGETYQENLDAVIKVGKAINREETMKQRLALHKQRMASFKAQLKSIKPTFAENTIQFAVISERGMWMHGPTSYAGGVVNQLGLRSPIPEQISTAYIPTSLELLLKANPDYLLIGRYSDNTVLEEWKKNPLFSMLTAKKKGHIIEISPGLWSLSRGMLAAEGVAQDLVRIFGEES